MRFRHLTSAPRFTPRRSGASSFTFGALAWLAAVALIVGPTVLAQAPSTTPVPESRGSVDPRPVLGALIDAAVAESLAAADRMPLLVTLTAHWESVESQPGVYDWTSLRRQIDALREDGHHVALRLTGPHARYLPDGGLPRAGAGESLAAWVAFTRSAAQTFAGQVGIYQVWQRSAVAGDLPDVSDYAFLLKNSVLALRAESAKAGIALTIAQTGVRPGEMEWQRRLWAQDSAAYIDIVPVVLDGASSRPDDIQAALTGFLKENLRHPPASSVWAVATSPTAPEADLLGIAVAALAGGADIAAADLQGRTDVRDALDWIAGAQALLAEDRAPAPLAGARVEDAEGSAIADARVLGRFFSDRDFSSLVFYAAPVDDGAGSTPRLVVEDRVVRDAYVVDPRRGEERRAGTSERAGGATGRAIRVARGSWPLAVRYRRAAVSPGFEVPVEEVETASRREPTAEEIIARYQAVQRTQDDALHRFTARGLLEYHFRLTEGGSSIDVGIESNYFWERGRPLEWEQVNYYINGAQTRWKKFPDLPLIQPEKVITLPLDLTLDRTYVYEKVGRARVDGRDAWVLAFQPHDPDAPASLYRGRLWIDAETFVRLKMSLVQTGLDVPILSNEETDRYQPIEGPDGEDFWLLTRVDGQQTWNAVGRTFVVQREMTFTDFRINPDPEAFAEQRETAYASKNTMMADTEEGFRYLERNPDGTRTVKERVSSSQLMVVAGALKDGATDGVTPLAGVNYFNYDLFKKKIQVNALFAGVLGIFTVSKPDLIGKRGDLTADAFLTAIKFEDSFYQDGEELEEEAIRNRPQRLNLRLGLPMGQFWKFNLIGSVQQNRYYDSEDGSEAITTFNDAQTDRPPRNLTYVLPRDHTLLSAGGQLEFNRRGYAFTLRAARSRRSDWDTFGLLDTTSGEYGSVDPSTGLFVPAAPEPVQEEFTQWRATVFKEWFLPAFQKARFEINYLDGHRLDRFSRYGFSQFGASRLSGFSGSGLRFDDGVIARGGYSFSVAKVLQLNGVVESAWVHRRDQDTGVERFTGVGISGNIPAPWRTVVNLSYGYSVASDIPGLKGESEFLLLVFKLF